MSRDRERFSFTLDGRRVEAEAGWTITDAAEAAGIWIPRLCHMPGLAPWGSCRVCTVRVNGRPCAACTQPAAPELLVESDTEELRELRRTIVEMLFVDGNHYCMACEKSGRCELQGLAYRLGLRAPLLPYLHPRREVDASHPDLLVDHNRCITCGRCVRASRDLDGKAVFGFVGRGTRKTVAVNGTGGLGGSEVELADRAVEVCPVGALLRKRVGFDVPVGRRAFDHEPIGARVERGEG